MPISYELKLHEGLIPLASQQSSAVLKADGAQNNSSDSLYVEIYSLEELEQLDVADKDVRDALAHLSHSHGSFANLLPTCIIGSLSFPTSKGNEDKEEHFGFYLDVQRLSIIDSTHRAKEVLENLVDLKLLPKISTARVLYEFMKYFIEDNPVLMADIEKKLNEIEDQITEQRKKIDNATLVKFRRKIMNHNRLYQQLTDLASSINKDDYSLLSKDDRRLFRLFGQRSDRLFQRTQYLKEYSLQLAQLYQMQIDSQQNKTIQWLTVVTSLVVPLTFITSWYGMNFKYMPELNFPYSYFIVIGICILIVVVQLIFFKKRKWL